MYILSLPLPEAEFNYYSIVMVPVTSDMIKKVIFKLHKNATVVFISLLRTTISKPFRKKLGKIKKTSTFAKLIIIL